MFENNIVAWLFAVCFVALLPNVGTAQERRCFTVCKAFGLLARWVSLLTNLGDALVLARWLNVDNKALLIGRATNPPVGECRSGKREQERAYQQNPHFTHPTFVAGGLVPSENWQQTTVSKVLTLFM